MNSKRDPLLEKRHILTPNRDSRESHKLAPKITLFSVSLVAHVYNSVIEVNPPHLGQPLKKSQEDDYWIRFHLAK